MSQKQKSFELPKSEKEQLKEQFEKVKAQPVSRVVRLTVVNICGCGSGEDIDIRRTVLYDSSLKNGDKIAIKDLVEGDDLW